MVKQPTIDDVAVALGMHKSTVSKALSGKGNVSSLTQARVRTAARELGYEPNPLAQRLATGYRNPLVYVVSATLDVGLSTQKIRLIQKALLDRALEVPIYTCPESAIASGPTQADQIRQLCRQRPRAIVCAVPQMDPHVFQELEAYRRAGGIVVSYDTPIDLACDQVLFDREDNGYRGARHLLENGHRRIGVGVSRLPEKLSLSEDTPQAARLRGVRRALKEFEAPPLPDEWVFENAHYEEGGEEMARRFLALPPDRRPTGLCIVNDYVAFAFMVDVNRAGLRIPGDLSLVSHDNQPIASRCPVPMTAVSHPVEEIANAVVGMLAERLDGYDGPPRRLEIQGELVQRASVGAPG